MSGARTFEIIINAEQDEATLKPKSIRSGGYAMMTEGVDFVLRFGSIMVLARLLVPESFGLIAMVSGFTMVAERFKDLGLSVATVQRKEITHKQVSTIFWVNAAAGAVLMLIIAALALPIAWFYEDRRVIPITLAISSGFLFSGFAVQHHALLRRQMKYAQLGIIQIAASLLSILVAIILAASGFGYWALVAREVLRNLFMTVGTLVFCPWVPSLPSRQTGVGSMLRFGGNLTATNLMYHVSFTIDQILIGRIFGASALGIYRQGVNLVLAPINNLTYPIVSVSESAMCRLQEDAERFRRFYRKILIGLSFVSVPSLLYLALYAEEMVLLALGPNWIEVTPIFRIMAIAGVLRPVATTIGPVMIACGFSRRVFWMGMVTSVAHVSFVLAGIPFGLQGMALAHVWSIYILLLPKVYWAFKGSPVTLGLFLGAIGRSLMAGCLMVGVLLFARQMADFETAFVRAIFGSLVGFLSYIGIWMMLPGGRAQSVELMSDVISHTPLRRIFPRRGQPSQ